MIVLVTGGSGFLGKHLVPLLSEARHGTVFAPAHLDGDLRDPAATDQLFGRTRPDIVVHLAAVVGGIGANQKEPGRFLHDNLQMGLHILESCRKHQVGRLVQIGTVCAYPKVTPIPFREEDLWNGYPEETNAPYGLAKRLLIEAGRAYRKQYGLNVVTVIPTNLYGPGDSLDLEHSHVIPALIRKTLEAQAAERPSVEIWGTGRASRDFLYVADAARGIARAAWGCNGEEPINLGSGREVSIRMLVSQIFRAVGYTGVPVWKSDRPDGQPRRCLDISRAAERLLGWTPTTSFEEGIQATVDDIRRRLKL